MHFQTLQRIIDTVPGSPIVCLTGGEPLLHPQIEKFIHYIKTKGLYCILTTNGWLLEKKAVDICNSHLDMLIISIDGAEKLHDRIRAPGSFHRASRGIELIQKRKDRPLLCVSEVINDLNFAVLHEIVEWVNNTGIDILNINHLWMQSDKMVECQNEIPTLPKTGIVDWRLSPQRIEVDQLEKSLCKVLTSERQFYLHVSPFLKNSELKTYYQEPERLVKVSETRCAWMVTKVWPNGDVKICREYKAGNVLQDPLDKIWNNATYREFRQYLADHKVCPICSRCCFLFPRL